MESSAPLKIKAYRGDDIRRITLLTSSSLDDLRAALTQRWPDAASCRLFWRDEDGDKITISTDADWQEVDRTTATLYLYVSSQQPTAPAADVPAALRALTAALGLDLPEEMLAQLAKQLSHTAPLARQLLAQHGGAPSPCAMFKHFFNKGGCGRPAEQPDGAAVHHGVVCDLSGVSPIVGTRYKKRGHNYDLCAEEFEKLPAEEKALYDAIEKPQRGCGFGMPFPFAAFMGRNCSPETTTPRAEPSPTGMLLPAAPLAPGARGPGVAQLQDQLIALGRMSPRAVMFCKGMYGPRTTQAVQETQLELQVEPTGVYDDAVKALLESEIAAKADEPESPADKAAVPAAAAVEEDPDEVERVTLLLSMGFDEAQAKAALSATKGSVERAADWLFENSATVPEEDQEALYEDNIAAGASAGELPPVPAEVPPPVFDEAWVPLATDLEDMGFEAAQCREALVQTKGDFKGAVRLLVASDRTARA